MKKLPLTVHSKECSSKWYSLSSSEQQAYRDMGQERKASHAYLKQWIYWSYELHGLVTSVALVIEQILT